eukprot:SAG31_NODE_5037_length_2783_cov_49.453800_2_plen_400_part_00
MPPGQCNVRHLRHPSVLLALLLAALPCAAAVGALTADDQFHHPLMSSGARVGTDTTSGRGAVDDASVQSAAAVARTAREIRGDATIALALMSVRMQPDPAVQASSLLFNFGLRTAQDLQLLGGGPEASELMGAIRDKLSLGDRAKLRLLVGDHAHVERIVRDGSTVWPRAQREAGHPPVLGENKHQTPWRLLQEHTAEDGLSTDTIAIVLSVLVGAAGYVLQALTARRAEHAQQEQDRANQHAETRRQREHEQMLSQIKRTDRWLDDCVNPLLTDIFAIVVSRASFVGEMVPELEANHSEALQALLAGVAPMFRKTEDGAITAARTGTVQWRPFEPALIRVWGCDYHSYPSANAYMITGAFLYTTMSQPFSAGATAPKLLRMSGAICCYCVLGGPLNSR